MYYWSMNSGQDRNFNIVKMTVSIGMLTAILLLKENHQHGVKVSDNGRYMKNLHIVYFFSVLK